MIERLEYEIGDYVRTDSIISKLNEVIDAVNRLEKGALALTDCVDLIEMRLGYRQGGDWRTRRELIKEVLAESAKKEHNFTLEHQGTDPEPLAITGNEDYKIPLEKEDTPKEAANELDKILAPVNELIRSVWSDEPENLKDEKQAILFLINKQRQEAKIEELKDLAKILPVEPPNIPGLTVVDTGRMYQQTLKCRIKELESKEDTE